MVPVIQMVITAFTVNAFRGIKSGLTTQWLVKVLELYGDTIARSLGLALMTLIVCVIVGVPAAWVLVREQRKRWAAFVEEAFILPLSMPGLAVGLGILLIWGGFSYFRQSIFFLLAGHVMFCLPFMVRSVTAVLRVEPLSQYEEASATLGASAWTTFRRVVVPVAMPGILAGALMVGPGRPRGPSRSRSVNSTFPGCFKPPTPKRFRSAWQTATRQCGWKWAAPTHSSSLSS